MVNSTLFEIYFGDITQCTTPFFFPENNLIHKMHEFLIFSMVNEHYLIWGNVKIYCSSLTLRAKISYRMVEFSSQLLYKTGLNAVMVVTLEN